MEEWKEYKLDVVCKSIADGDHMPPPKVERGIPFVTISNIKDNRLDLSDTYFVPQKYYDALDSKRKPQMGDTIYSVVGTFGKPVYIKDNNPFVFQRHIAILRPDASLLNPLFLYYTLLSPQFYRKADIMAIGAVQRTISLTSLRNTTIQIPSLAVQKEIVSILKSLDDKIEVNRRINDNLEQQAQALFKSWFVDFKPFKDGEFVESELGMIPKEWRVVSLDEMTSKFGTGLNPRKNFKLGEGNNYYVTIKNMGNNRVYLDERCDKVTDEAIEKINKRSKLQAGDLLFSGIGTIGRVALITETPTNWNTSESVFNMHPADNISSEFLYVLLLSDVFQQYVKLHAQGGVQQGIRMASLKEYKMAIPDDNILQEFDKKVIPLVSLVKKTDDETDRLATLRDTLLPKLMSGELKVNDIKE